jgi:glycosyltransferase involved in cell wall biosynthesis
MVLDLRYTGLQNEHIFKQQNADLLNDKQYYAIESVQTQPQVLLVTSFPPNECGIATYSQDLVQALRTQFKNSFAVTICALETQNQKHKYLNKPKFVIETDLKYSYYQIAAGINADRATKLVVIQHEFGFFAKQENAFKHFYRCITKPIIFVFHTVLPNPNEALKISVQDMSEFATSIIVMTENAARILEMEYNIRADKITVIAHGTHLISANRKEDLKLVYALSNKLVLSTFGLLGSSKSIETTINALPKVVEEFPEVLFLLLGKTHPNIIKNEGEQYRLMLQQKVTDLHLENNVRFVNNYLQLPVLMDYLQLTDIYLFTSKDPNQAVSGTFAYAISSGCPVISTPIPHAKEIINHDNGLLFEFGNSNQLAETIIFLLKNENTRKKISLNSLHKMASTSWQNAAIAHAHLIKKSSKEYLVLRYEMPVIKLDYIQKMTTDFAMVQFANISEPDLLSGYTLDDNARALVAICQHYKKNKEPYHLEMIEKYLQFINFCQQPNGTFLNYVNHQKEFTSQNYSENLDDSNGRAIWALGYIVSQKNILPSDIILQAEEILHWAIQNVEQIHSTRAMAFMIKGLHYSSNPDYIYLIKIFADRLVQMYMHEKSADWDWFENYLTYGNSLLPEAMLCAHLSTHSITYKLIAIESFDFLLSKIIVNEKIKVISNKGWHTKNIMNVELDGGEQPIDVAYTILALEKFYRFTGNQKYKEQALVAFSWFLGVNHLNQIVYNPCTGGCYDGVEETNINLNQGAESTLSYLLARLAMERINEGF